MKYSLAAVESISDFKLSRPESREHFLPAFIPEIKKRETIEKVDSEGEVR